MKMNKKVTALCAVLVGALVFSGAALADVAAGSAYGNLKQAVKTTSSKVTKEYDNMTYNASMEIQMDGKTVASTTENGKADMKNRKKETISKSTNLDGSGTSEHYNYSDKTMEVSRSNDDAKYQVYRYPEEYDANVDVEYFSDPFESEYATDVEKIVDAFVGNLKDSVQLEEKDGKKLYTADITESQVPALANALTSFAYKCTLGDYSGDESSALLEIGHMTQDIYVKEVVGKAVEGADGALESVVGAVTINGKDEDGKAHTVTISMNVEIKDINKTTVTAPELTDENAEYSTAIYDDGEDISIIDDSYVGEYTQNLVKEENKKTVKYGERHLTISSVKDGVITGNYYETYTDADKQATARKFDFTGKISGKDGLGDAILTYTENGTEKTAILTTTGTYCENLSLSVDVTIEEDGEAWTDNTNYDEDPQFDGELIRVWN